MKIYTKKGDDGSTALFGGRRVMKHELRIEAYGSVDELNSFLGLLSDQKELEDFRIEITAIQERLFTLGSALAADPEKSNLKKPDLPDADIAILELKMDEMEEQLPPLKNFILPGGHPAVSLCHVCRAVCRRAERRASELASRESVDPVILRYLNRLSDYLFVLSRLLAKRTGAEERPWKPRG